MGRFCTGLLVASLLLGTIPVAAGESFSTIHEVIRQFEVGFVDRPNLAALLLGGLSGLKQAAPGCEIEVLAHPNLLRVKAGGKTASFPETAISDFKSLEAALAQAAGLALEAKLASDRKRLEHLIIRELVTHCGDPWTVYLEADLYQSLLDDGSKEVGDLGLLVEPVRGELHILDVVPESSAAKAGILPGMRLEQVAGRPAEALNELEALALMRGPVGQKVALTVAGKPLELTFAPEPKRNIEVDQLPNGLARIRLLNFRAETGKRLGAVLGKLNQATPGGLRGLVLDLRGNPGGLVTEGTEVVGLFINGGKVVSVISQKHTRTEVEQSPRPGPFRSLPLVLLTDHRSASVSEIVAMALRDHGRAKLVGTKTLGKGTVQVVIELMDGSALKISNGRYYSPNGTPLYEGIEPDVEVAWDGKGEDVQLKQALGLLR